MYSDYDSMKYYAEKSLIISKKWNYLDGQAESYFQVGSYYLNTLKYDTALYYFNESVKLFQEIEADYNTYRCYNSIGMAHIRLANIDSGIYYYEKAKEGFVSLGNKLGQAAIEVNIGIEYYHNGDIAEAIKRLENAIKLFESIGNINERALAYRNLGMFYHSIGDYKKGTESLIQAIRFAQKSGNKLIESAAYSNIGIMFAQQEQFTESITYFKKCYELSSELNDTLNIIIALNNLVDSYFGMNNLKKSMKKYEEALSLHGNYIPLEQKAVSLMGIALIHEKNKDYKNAEYHFNKALANTDEHWNIEAFRGASKGLFNVYRNLKNYEKTLTYYIRHVEFKDSISNKKNSQKLIRETLNLQHQNEITQIELGQKKKELMAEKEKARQVALKNYFMVGFAFVFILAVIIFLSLRKNRKKNKELKELNEEVRTQKELIQSQNEELTITNEKLVELDRFKEAMTGMIVHDLKNPLNAILNLQQENPAQAVPLVMQSGKQMLNMVLNILDVYKHDESKMVLDKINCSLTAIITKAIKEVEFLSEQKNVKIENTVKDKIIGY